MTIERPHSTEIEALALARRSGWPEDLRVLLTCYRFDPATRRFGPFIRGFMRIGGVMIFASVAVLLAALFRAERMRRARVEGAP